MANMSDQDGIDYHQHVQKQDPEWGTKEPNCETSNNFRIANLHASTTTSSTMAGSYTLKVEATSAEILETGIEVCRLCTSQGSCQNMLPIFEQSLLAERITWVSQLQMCEDDGLPCRICHQCRFQVDLAFDFKTLCWVSDKALRQALTNQQMNDTKFLEDIAQVDVPGVDDLASEDLVGNRTSGQPEHLDEIAQVNLPCIDQSPSLPADLEDIAQVNLPCIDESPSLPVDLEEIAQVNLPCIDQSPSLPADLEEIAQVNLPSVDQCTSPPADMDDIVRVNLPCLEEPASQLSNPEVMAQVDVPGTDGPLPAADDVGDFPVGNGATGEARSFPKAMDQLINPSVQLCESSKMDLRILSCTSLTREEEATLLSGKLKQYHGDDDNAMCADEEPMFELSEGEEDDGNDNYFGDFAVSKKRGRPRKITTEQDKINKTVPLQTSRKRGRPRKNPFVVEEVAVVRPANRSDDHSDKLLDRETTGVDNLSTAPNRDLVSAGVTVKLVHDAQKSLIITAEEEKSEDLGLQASDRRDNQLEDASSPDKFSDSKETCHQKCETELCLSKKDEELVILSLHERSNASHNTATVNNATNEIDISLSYVADKENGGCSSSKSSPAIGCSQGNDQTSGCGAIGLVDIGPGHSDNSRSVVRCTRSTASLYQEPDQVEDNGNDAKASRPLPVAEDSLSRLMEGDSIAASRQKGRPQLTEGSTNADQSNSDTEPSSSKMLDEADEELLLPAKKPKRPAAPVEKKLWKCTDCDKEFKFKKDLTAHLTNHGTRMLMECTFCHNVFCSLPRYNTHVRAHKMGCHKGLLRKLPKGSHDSYECDICSMKFNLAFELKKHCRAHWPGESHLCDICGKSLPLKASLDAHKKTEHAGEKLFKCKVCQKPFTFLGSLKDHIHLKHPEEYSHQCDSCQETFETIEALQAHISTHMGVASHVCNRCGKKFSLKKALNCHIRNHDRARPYICETCGKSFTTMSAMTAHRRIHTGERSFKCHICLKAFVHHAARRMHLLSHSKVMSCACNICGKSFRHNGTLKRHMVAHSNLREYKCTVCGLEFLHKNNLNRHLNNMHGRVADKKKAATN